MFQAKSERNYLVYSVIYLIVIAITYNFFPEIIPFKFFEFWKIEGTVSQWMYAALPIFIWAFVINVIISGIISTDDDTPTFGSFVGGATLISTWAGVVEEICFRWIIFFGAIGVIVFWNYLVFGCAGFGVTEWLHINVFGPLTSLISFNKLDPYLFHPHSWSIGASMLFANAFFRDGHKYQGFLGYANSWFMGLYFFWIMFTYGLPAAILIHFTYDMVCFFSSYLAIKCRIGR